jgi:hypothetical protein
MEILNSLEERDVLRALEELTPVLPEIENGPNRSTRYDLRWQGRSYPPKLVVSKAAELRSGKPFPVSLFSGGNAIGQANRILTDLGFEVVPKENLNSSSPPRLPLELHGHYGRKEAFACFGIEYNPRQQHRNTGLSPRLPDDGYFIFITLNKEAYEPQLSYDDQLYADRFIWVRRRGRGEDHPDYVRLRQPHTRVSLFVRNSPRELFTYLGELEYAAHTEFTDEATSELQQSYSWRLRHPLSDKLLTELTFGSEQPIKQSKPTRSTPKAARKGRRPATLDEYKKAYSYAVGATDRTVIPEHHHYQVRLKKYLESCGVDAEFERDFIDVAFSVAGKRFIGEIKVTTHLSLAEAFRSALGQLIEYAHLRHESPPSMIMFLDHRLDERRVELATKFAITVIAEEGGSYVVLNPEVASYLLNIFSDGHIFGSISSRLPPIRFR